MAENPGKPLDVYEVEYKEIRNVGQFMLVQNRETGEYFASKTQISFNDEDLGAVQEELLTT